jgi:hypothetical protein
MTDFDFDKAFNEGFNEGIEKANIELENSTISNNNYSVNGMSSKLENFILNEEIRKIDIHDDVNYLNTWLKEHRDAYKN